MCVCACVHACVRVCGCVGVWVGGCWVCMRVRSCARECVRACACVCVMDPVCKCLRVRLFIYV